MKQWLQRRVVRWALRHIVALCESNVSYAELARYGIEDIGDSPDFNEWSIVVAKTKAKKS